MVFSSAVAALRRRQSSTGVANVAIFVIDAGRCEVRVCPAGSCTGHCWVATREYTARFEIIGHAYEVNA